MSAGGSLSFLIASAGIDPDSYFSVLDQEIEDGILTLDNVSDYKTVRITPIYKGTVTFVDESNPEDFNLFDPMEGEEGTSCIQSVVF